MRDSSLTLRMTSKRLSRFDNTRGGDSGRVNSTIKRAWITKRIGLYQLACPTTCPAGLDPRLPGRIETFRYTLYPKVSFSDVPMGREEIASAKKLWLTATWIFCANCPCPAQCLL